MGSLHRELRGLEAENLIEAVRTERVGRRPERTVYMAAFAVGPSFALALFLLASASLCRAATQVIVGTMVQQATPDALRGWISALGSAGQNGLAGLAASATSALAVALGPGGPSPHWPRPSPARASCS